MKAQAKITKALRKIMSNGEANACEVYKGYDYDGVIAAYGWFYRPFGRNPQYLGQNLQEALEKIEAIAAVKEEMQY